MKPTLLEILATLPTASHYTWDRGSGPRRGELTIFHDSITDDKREIVKVCLGPKTIRVERRRLTQWNPPRKRWDNYSGGADEYGLPTRAGEKALRELIKSKAIEITGHSNPSFFSWFATA